MRHNSVKKQFSDVLSYQGELGLSTLAVRDIIHMVSDDVFYMPRYDCICCPEMGRKPS